MAVVNLDEGLVALDTLALARNFEPDTNQSAHGWQLIKLRTVKSH